MAPFKDYYMLQVYTHSQLEPHLWGSGTQQKNYFGTLFDSFTKVKYISTLQLSNSTPRCLSREKRTNVTAWNWKQHTEEYIVLCAHTDVIQY